MSLRFLVLGGSGQLGRYLCRFFSEAGHVVQAPSEQACNLFQPLDTKLFAGGFDVLVNCAAYTQVDEAESHGADAHHLNAVVPEKLAEIAKAQGAIFVHVSTDYVFSGDAKRPYTEDDPPRPLNIYGRTKLEGEMAVQAVGGKYYLARTSGLYGPGGAAGKGGHCMVDFILNTARQGKPLRLVQDQWSSPTYVGHFTQVIAQLIDLRAPFGCYHAVNEGVCTWMEFGQEALRQAGIQYPIEAVSSEVFAARPAQRPRYSAMANKKLNGFGIRVPGWKEGIKDYLKSLTPP